MKTRDNINIEVIVNVTMTKAYETIRIATATKSMGGSFDTKQIAANVKALSAEAKNQVLDTIDAVACKDETEEEKEEK